MFREGFIPFLYNLFDKMKEEGTCLNSLYDAIVTLIPQLEGDSTKKKEKEKRKLLTNSFYEYRCKPH